MEPTFADLLTILIEHLDIPPSLYEKAAARHRSLAEWLKRENSTLRHLEPDIRPQGSFRLGLVVRPLNEGDEYDLDNVCLLKALRKSDQTQQELKRLYGEEIKAYVRAQGMLKAPTEHKRCWRLHYADEVNFHLDTLACVPEDDAVIARLIGASVEEALAKRAVAITDRTHPHYAQITRLWYSSNPRGFARWFEGQAALGRRLALREGGVRATIEDVPPYEWKTPLQRSIQILKRHRDVMFRDNCEIAPISMIITNLAARAYVGETDIAVALVNIVNKMPDFVRAERPRIPNPADPAEDYADKWSKDLRLEKAFWDWHHTVKNDLRTIRCLIGTTDLGERIERLFSVGLTQRELRLLGSEDSRKVPTVARAAPLLVIPTAPKPWGVNG
jgi:hypothetical protein